MNDKKIRLAIFISIGLSILSINCYSQKDNSHENIYVDCPVDIRRLIEDGLDYSLTPTDRINTICYLGKMGARAVPAIPSILLMLSDPNDGELDNSMFCWQQGPKRSWTLAYDDPMYTTPGDEAARALVAIGKPAVEPLIESLKNNSPWEYESAAWALGEIGDLRAVEPLINALKEYPCESVAWALGKFRDRRAVYPLVDYFKKHGSETAIWALIQLEDPRAIDPMITALKSEHLNVRKNAARFLGDITVLWEINNFEAVAPLISAIKDHHHQVRENVAIALGQIGDSRAVNPLLIALNDSIPLVREYTAWALGEIRNDRAAKGLVIALKDENSNVKANAAGALGKIGAVNAINPLITVLEDEDEIVQEYAVVALGKIGDYRAVDPLVSLVEHQNWRVRNSAQWALKMITGQDFGNNLAIWKKWWKQKKGDEIK